MLRNKSYFIFLGILLILYLVIQALKPEPVDWTPSFSKDHTRPYGNYALFRLLNSIFPGQPVSVSRKNLYETLPSYSEGYNYILITQSVNFNEEELEVLRDFIHRGNNVFIAAEDFNYDFCRYWEFEIGYTSSIIPDYWNTQKRSKVTVNFNHLSLKSDSGYSLRYDQYEHYFKNRDTSKYFYEKKSEIVFPEHIRVLGTINNQWPNFIAIKEGNGKLFLHSNPKIFSNYNIVYNKENHAYVSKALSYLPLQPVIWDEYFNRGPEGAQTEIRYILSSRGLRWGWFVLLSGIALYMLFESKRRQRLMPVIQPPVNTTLEFVNTVGRLYYQQKDHTNLAKKKVTFFLEHIRKQYYLDTQELNEEFTEMLAARSGIDREFIFKLVKLLNTIQQSTQIDEKELLYLNRQIELFNLKSK